MATNPNTFTLISLNPQILAFLSPTHFRFPLLLLYNRFFSLILPSLLQVKAKNHVISSYSDLSVTLDIPSSNLRFFLVRGSPFLTCSVMSNTSIAISTIHPILSLSSNSSLTKHTLKLNNGQTWLIYSSSQMNLSHWSESNSITSDGFSGIVRVAIVPDSNRKHEAILDRFSSCYAVSGNADFTKPFSIEYKWEKSGFGELLMLAHPLHIKLLSSQNVIILNDFKYRSIDGDLVGVIGDSWPLKSDPISITWHSIKGAKDESPSSADIVSSLCKDVESLSSSSAITTANSSYQCAKSSSRAARLAVIAEEIGHTDVLPAIKKHLKETIEPWLDGTLTENGFLYDEKWGGIITKQGSTDPAADNGIGVYNDHLNHLGYFIYSIAVLAKIDPFWGNKYKPQAYSLMADFMNIGSRQQANSSYTRLRCFDIYKLHSWTSGLTESSDGRRNNSTSSSEAVNAYYSAALMGLAYGDTHLISIGSTLAAMEIQAAQTWWHVKEGESSLYEEEFSKENRLVGVLWANKRESKTLFMPKDNVPMLLPVSEILFGDLEFVKEFVNWGLASLEKEGVSEGWKGFVYTMEGVYDKESALEKIRNLKDEEEGNCNSLTNMLWWIHSRRNEGEQDELCKGGGKFCWFAHYCL